MINGGKIIKNYVHKFYNKFIIELQKVFKRRRF